VKEYDLKYGIFIASCIFAGVYLDN